MKKTSDSVCVKSRRLPNLKNATQTMKKLNNPAYVKRLSYLCALAYLASYLTRVNFATVMVAIISDTGWEKSEISAVTTALFVAYGAGQLVSGWLGDRLPPNRIILTGLMSTTLLNLLIPICTSIPQMTVVWGLNGLAQAMMWPPIVRILTSACSSKDYQTATVLVSSGGSIGTLLTFVIASICTGIFGWRPVFFVCATASLITAVIWIFAYSRIRRYSNSEENASLALSAEDSVRLLPDETVQNQPASDDSNTQASGISMPRSLYLVLGIVLLSVIILGALRDSIAAWLPSYVAETFNLGNGIAILTGVVLPIATTATYPVVLWYYRRFFSSEILCAATIYGISAASAFLLSLLNDVNPILSVLLLAVISSCMHAANFLIIGLLPERFTKYGNVGAISGIINSFVYVGSSISIWGIAVIAEQRGWLITILTWGILSLIGVALSILAYKLFKKQS